MTNLMLATVWYAVAQKGGTRADVVREIMRQEGVEDTPDNYKKFYNSVTQRYKMLTKDKGVEFPALKMGDRGVKADPDELAAIQTILRTGSCENMPAVKVRKPRKAKTETATESTPAVEAANS